MFDIVGDVHGCFQELDALLTQLDYSPFNHQHPQNRQVVFVGDLIDRGPDPISTLRLVMSMVEHKQALCVMGNHDDKLYRYLKGNNIIPKHGLKDTIDLLKKEPQDFGAKVFEFLHNLPYQLLLDEGRLHVSHAGLPEKLHGINNSKSRSHSLYGDVDGTTDANGLPIRKDWAANYKGSRIVVHGHVPVKEVTIKNGVWDVDSGCAFGNKLTALRYPEMTSVSVPALKNYMPGHPFGDSP